MSINEKGYWEGLEAESQHAFDPHLSYALLTFLKKENPKTVADFGCGMGNYVKHLSDLNKIRINNNQNKIFVYLLYIFKIIKRPYKFFSSLISG